MTKINSKRIFNVFLRFLTALIRFCLMIVLAKFLSPAEIGYYGLFSASIGYALYIVGFDFYTYLTREIIRSEPHDRGRMIKGQGALSLGLYAVVIPAALYLLVREELPPVLIAYFIPIMILEHVNQELSRLFTAMSRQITASIIIFIRQGAWVIGLIALMVLSKQSRIIDTVLVFWTGAGLFAALFGLWTLRHLDVGGWRRSIDWRWVRRGVTISLWFFLATVALRSVQTLDRYWLMNLGGIEVVGAYVLFIGMAGSLLTFLDAGVFAFTYPEMIKLNHLGERGRSRSLFRKALLVTIAVCAVFIPTSLLVLPHLLAWIGNTVYLEQSWLYPWVLSAMILSALSLAPHFALYAANNDRPIVFSHLAALAGFLLATWLASKVHGILAIPVGLNVAFLIILIVKSISCFMMYARNRDISSREISP